MHLFICLVLTAAALGAQPVAELFGEKLKASIAGYDAKMDGAMGVAIVDLSTGEKWSYHGKTVFPTASVIKVPILIELFRLREAGRLDFAERVTVQPAESVGGSGVLQERLKSGPVSVSIEEIVREMIVSSDNTATNWCIRRIGMGGVNRTMATMGYSATRLQRVMIDQAAATRNEENVSTPEELADLARVIYEGKAVSGKASAEMIAIMKQVKGEMRKAVPGSVEVASKVGELVGVRAEMGIVYAGGRPFALAVMGSFLKEGFSPVEAITRLVFEHFVRLGQGNIYGNLGVR